MKPVLTLYYFYIEATNLSGSATADVSAGFDLFLVDD